MAIKVQQSTVWDFVLLYIYIYMQSFTYFSRLFEPEVLIAHTGTARVPWQVLEVPNEAGFEEEVKVERMILKKYTLEN